MTKPIDQATKDRIEKEAIAFADSIEVNSIATHTGLVKGYIAGATVWAEKLKQERNKAIDDVIEAMNNLVQFGWIESPIEEIRSELAFLKDKSHE